jgi:hypothetical protein
VLLFNLCLYFGFFLWQILHRKLKSQLVEYRFAYTLCLNCNPRLQCMTATFIVLYDEKQSFSLDPFPWRSQHARFCMKVYHWCMLVCACNFRYYGRANLENVYWSLGLMEFWNGENIFFEMFVMSKIGDIVYVLKSVPVHSNKLVLFLKLYASRYVKIVSKIIWELFFFF